MSTSSLERTRSNRPELRQCSRARRRRRTVGRLGREALPVAAVPRRARALEAQADLPTHEPPADGILGGPELQVVVENGRALAGERRLHILAASPAERAHR